MSASLKFAHRDFLGFTPDATARFTLLPPVIRDALESGAGNAKPGSPLSWTLADIARDVKKNLGDAKFDDGHCDLEVHSTNGWFRSFNDRAADNNANQPEVWLSYRPGAGN